MCRFISWIEHDGKNWYLTKNELNSDKGVELLEYCGRVEDLVGHGAIQYYYNFSGGFNKECIDFTDPSMFPAEIIQALKEGLFEGMGLPIDTLTLRAQAKYNKIQQQAWAEYNKIERQAWAVYDKIQQQAWAEYNKIEQPAWDEYDKVEQPAWAAYIEIDHQTLAKYDKIQQQAWDEHTIISQQAFWKLFKNSNTRIEIWR